MTDDSFEEQLPDDLKPIADALHECRQVADGHLLDRVLHRIRAISRPRPRLWLSMPRLAVIASFAVAVVIGAQLSHVNVLRGVATLAGSITTTSSTSLNSSAAGLVYCTDGADDCYVYTPGYWKNHQTQTQNNLPEPLGSFYTVKTFTQAQAVFAAMNCSNSSTSSQNAVGCLAGQLLAAELNVHNGVAPPSCAASAISQANTFLSTVTRSSPAGIGYLGPTGTTYILTSAQRTQAIALANTLNSFNNTGSC